MIVLKKMMEIQKVMKGRKKDQDKERIRKKDSESELVEDEWMEKEISNIITVISVAVSGVNVVKDE